MFVNISGMCIVFRVEASPVVGLGHLMRCLALAQGLNSRNVRVFFAVSQNSLHHYSSRSDWPGETFILTSESELDEHKELQQFCTQVQADWLILDGYQFDSDYRKLLDLNACKLAMFDDGQLLDEKSEDNNLAMIINWASGADKLAYYDVAPNALCCTGANYRVLRREFYQSAELPFERRTRLIIMFGGSDPSNLTLPLLERLDSSSIRLPVTVITGSAYQHLEELARFKKFSHLCIKHFHDSHAVADIFQQGRLAISAAGASQFELLHCATPSILVATVDNQLFASEQASTQGWCCVSNAQGLLGQPHDDAFSVRKKQLLEQLAQKTLALWHQPEQLQNMHSNARAVCQPNGCEHIFRALYPASVVQPIEAVSDE
jgi:UDP-2,4-diacetamido-2,4,6-trideoxy-beta-L-altropyranose hydrolase